MVLKRRGRLERDPESWSEGVKVLDLSLLANIFELSLCFLKDPGFTS